MDIFAFVFLSSSLFLFYFVFSDAADRITQSQSLSDSKGTNLVSKDGGFVLGFFSTGNSNNRYLGVWYNNISVRTVVWVANRGNPIRDSSGVLMLNSSGSLVLLSQNRTVVWSANSTKEAGSPVVELLDSGNIVLREKNEENPDNYLWQSFDYPSDTWLPGMKLGWDLRTGLERRLTAWKSPDDPSPGELSCEIVPHNYPEMVTKNGSKIYIRTGPWNGIRFSGALWLKANTWVYFTFVSNKDEVYFTYQTIKKSLITRAALNQTFSVYKRYIWIEADKKWTPVFSIPRDNCDSYNLCGAYGNCIIGDSPMCKCLEGFKPKSPERWNIDDWTEGCVRTTELSCKDKDKIGFVKLVGLKLPDTTYSWVNKSMNLSECSAQCLNNCSCMAYSNTDIRDGGSGCAIWYGDLIDIRQVAVGGQDANLQDVFYIRMPASKKVNQEVSPHKKKVNQEDVIDKQKMKVRVAVAIAIAVVFGVLLIAYCICKRKSFRGNITFFDPLWKK